MAKKDNRKKALDAEISKAMMNDFERLGEGFITYWKLIAAVVVGIALLAAAIAWAATHQRDTARAAREALASATSTEALAKAIEENSSSSAVPFARFRLAEMLIQGKEYDKAAEQLKLIGAANGDAQLAAKGTLLEGYTQELAGKDAEAVALFSELVGRIGVPQAIQAEARFAAGRLQVKLNNLDRAVEILSTARPNNPPQGIADNWNKQSADLLLMIKSGEFAAPAAK